MATDNSTDLTNTCMLVSDSNETSKQLDSKQLGYSTLVELAQDNLFRKFLDMSKYLTYSQFDVYSGMLQGKYDELNAMKQALTGQVDGHRPKFRTVNGQVILIEADNVPEGMSPEEHVRSQWDIPPECQLLPIPNCMLRGMLHFDSGDSDESNKLESNKLEMEKQQNERVVLTKDNIPQHMHHSSVTTGASFTTMVGNQGDPGHFTKGNVAYDMFYNDSLDVGLSKNELDGTIDEFTVDECGVAQMSHDNMPKYHAFYGFVVLDATKKG